MTGALLGAAHPQTELPGPLADRRYIEHEADRMFALSDGRPVIPFPHPDLRRWQAPRTQSDALALADAGHSAVSGLGPARAADEEIYASSGNGAMAWQWVDLWFGQRLLIKRREHIAELQPDAVVEPVDAYLAQQTLDYKPPLDERTDHGRVGREPERTSRANRRTLHELTDEAIAAGFDPQLLGRHLLELSESDDGIERATQYAAVIAKARLTRRDRHRMREATGSHD